MTKSKRVAAERIEFSTKLLAEQGPRATAYTVWDENYTSHGALGMRVAPTGVATLFLQYRAGEGRSAKQVKQKLRRLDEFLLSDQTISDLHREASQIVLDARTSGGVPKKRQTPTFAEVAKDYLAMRAETKPYAPGGAEAAARAVRRANEVFGSKKIGDVKRADVRAVLKPLKPHAAAKTLRILNTIFKEAVQELELIEKNPCTGIQIEGSEYIPRDAVMTNDEMGRFWAAISVWQAECPTTAHAHPEDPCDALRLIAITGQRKGAVLGMRWQDIDLETGVWTQAAERTKNRKAFAVTLDETALAILKGIRARRDAAGRVKRESDWVFPSRTQSGHIQSVAGTFRRVLERAGLADHGFVVHDLRATFATALLDDGETPKTVAALTGHKSEAILLKSYNRRRETREELRQASSKVSRAYTG